MPDTVVITTLTRDDIERLPAGEWLDILVLHAVKIKCPFPSLRTESALAVIESYRESGICDMFTITSAVSAKARSLGHYATPYNVRLFPGFFEAQADTLPLAICRTIALHQYDLTHQEVSQ